MGLRIVKLGGPRLPEEGLRIGTVRRPPRGVRKEDFSRLGYYDVWLPELSPSAELVKEAQAAEDERAWKQFTRKFRAEMNEAGPSHTLDLLAAMSHSSSLSVGCYCEDEQRCHRSVLRDLLVERGANLL